MGMGGDCLNRGFSRITRISRIHVVGWAVVDDSGNGDGGGEKRWSVGSESKGGEGWKGGRLEGWKRRNGRIGRWGWVVVV